MNRRKPGLFVVLGLLGLLQAALLPVWSRGQLATTGQAGPDAVCACAPVDASACCCCGDHEPGAPETPDCGCTLEEPLRALHLVLAAPDAPSGPGAHAAVALPPGVAGEAPRLSQDVRRAPDAPDRRAGPPPALHRLYAVYRI